MKRFLSLAVLAVLTATAICVRAQGTFQNLDFEQARIVFVNTYNSDMATTNALPGWSAFAGINQLSIVQFGRSGALFPVMLYAATNGGSIDGNFSVLLGGGLITQEGMIPALTQSLMFKVATGFLGGPVSVSIDGRSLPYVTISNGSNYILCGADISSFAGQTATLAFTGGTMLDDIQFSSQPIPEPSAAVLLALSALIFAARRLRGRRGAP